MGRHRHVTCVRSDGLSAVLRPLLDDRRIVAATLVDVDSGLVLDGYSDDADLGDLELLGAGHADTVRTAAVLAGAGTLPPDAEITVGLGDDRFHLLHAVPDPHGDRLVLSVVVRGARRVRRARRRLRAVSVAALTAGPTLSRRPVDGVWTTTAPDPVPDRPSPEERPSAGELPASEERPSPGNGRSPRSGRTGRSPGRRGRVARGRPGVRPSRRRRCLPGRPGPRPWPVPPRRSPRRPPGCPSPRSARPTRRRWRVDAPGTGAPTLAVIIRTPGSMSIFLGRRTVPLTTVGAAHHTLGSRDAWRGVGGVG